MTIQRSTARPRLRAVPLTLLLALMCLACGGPDESDPPARPSILIVTLDTTRADAVGPDAMRPDVTPAFNALAARGRRFRQAYATAPETLPSHASMFTGLYPAGHGVHENGRSLARSHPVLAEQLKAAGYRTAAFTSAFVLARRFGLERGFDVYDDTLAEDGVERSAAATTEQAAAWLREPGAEPRFLWVHYFDPHAPYEPPAPYRDRFVDSPYLGEVAAMDDALGRLVADFEQHAPGPTAIVVVADHGEGLGDHGEAQHGYLLYQSTMRVPLLLVGPAAEQGTVAEAPVSIRRIYDTVLGWAGLAGDAGLLGSAAPDEVVLAEAMKPYLGFGWQPQVMGVAGRQKFILTGRMEMYDLAADPGESRDLAATTTVPAPVRQTLESYPVPSPDAARTPDALSAEAREQLASLGYVSAVAAPVVRRDAPRPADMTHLFARLDRASGLFVAGRYAELIPVLREILDADPNNLDAVLRLATAHSSLGQDAQAAAAFRRAIDLAPRSPDVRLYAALHQARGPDWQAAAPVLEELVGLFPDRLPALEGLARLRERQGRVEDAVDLYARAHALAAPTAAASVSLGQLAMSVGRTPEAIAAFERARAADARAFRHDLELGVLYLAARRLLEARDALDRVPDSHPDYPMALFKRAQVSVLLGEPDRAARAQRALDRADDTTRPLIAAERLFQGLIRR